MNLVVYLLIVSGNLAAPTDARYPDAVEVFHCQFDDPWDKNLDHWPDGWARRRGEGYPKYLPVAIAADPATPAKPCLRMDLDGGAATLYSPEIKVDSMFNYVLEGRLKTELLKRHRAFISVTFYDEKSAPLETFSSARIRDAADWLALRIGPMTPTHAQAHHAVIALHLEPSDGGDLKGAAMFDDIWFARLPRMTLRTNSETNLYAEGSRPEIKCQVSGFPAQDPLVTCELEDVFGNVLAQEQRRLEPDASGAVSGQAASNESVADRGFAGSATWVPPIDDVGFYRIRIKMPDRNALMHERFVHVAVLRAQTKSAGGEFGWTLPRGDHPLALGPLAQVLGQSGVHWVKFPLWYGNNENRRAERLAWFSERLNFQGIELVGLLTDPPAELRQQLGQRPSTAADLFSADEQLWYPALEPVMTRLSLKVRWWQLGHDTDTSFVGYPNLPEKIAQIKKQFQRFGTQVHLGIGWRWINEFPKVSKPPWTFLSLSAEPPLSTDELATYLSASESKRTKRWVVVEPLPRETYDLSTRAADLVERLVTAKRMKSDAIFIADPFDAQRGLMNADGTPSELFLPWRTTALHLAGAEYLGSITLPMGSQNHVFTRGGETLMVVWSHRAVQETVYLDENAQAVDVWGRREKIGRGDGPAVLEVGPMPKFVTGLSEPVMRWQIGLAFASAQLPNIAGQQFSNTIGVKNYFGQGVGGSVRLFAPDGWRVSPRETNFKLAPGETMAEPFDIMLPFGAISGRQKVRLDFDINADRPHRFSIYRELQVGSDDVVLEVLTRLNAQGELEVDQTLINNTDQPVSFKCQLFVPDRLRMLSAVLDQGRGRNTRVYRIPDGKDVIGKTLLLRAEEVDGSRILNYRFVADK